MGRESDWLRAGRSGEQIVVEAIFSAPVQTGPGAHPAPCTTGIDTLLMENIVSPLRTNITLNQSWRTYGMRKDFLGTRYSLLSQFLYFPPQQPSLYCKEHIFIYTCLTAWRFYMNYCCYQIIQRAKHFCTNRGAVESVNLIFIIGALTCRRLGKKF